MTEETDMASATATATKPQNKTPSPEAQAEAVLQQALRVLTDEYLDCRGIAHWWVEEKPLHVVERVAEGHSVERILRCDRCDTVKHERHLLRVDRWEVQRLERLDPRYDYPKDYLMSEMARVDHSKELVRMEQLRRALGGTAGLNRALKKAAQNEETGVE